MPKIKIKAITVESFEEEIEAENEDQAEEIFTRRFEEGELESHDNYILFEGTEEYNLIKDSVFNENDNDLTITYGEGSE